MSKLTIEGRPLGTTAENVGYTNSDMNGVTHAKGGRWRQHAYTC